MRGAEVGTTKYNGESRSSSIAPNKKALPREPIFGQQKGAAKAAPLVWSLSVSAEADLTVAACAALESAEEQGPV